MGVGNPDAWFLLPVEPNLATIFAPVSLFHRLCHCPRERRGRVRTREIRAARARELLQEARVQVSFEGAQALRIGWSHGCGFSIIGLCASSRILAYGPAGDDGRVLFAKRCSACFRKRSMSFVGVCEGAPILGKRDVDVPWATARRFCSLGGVPFGVSCVLGAWRQPLSTVSTTEIVRSSLLNPGASMQRRQGVSCRRYSFRAIGGVIWQAWS